MKSGDSYRFTLSWPMTTEAQIIVGEFLNRLGNKKSRFIVQLVSDYLASRPELLNPDDTLKIIINTGSVGENLTNMIRSIIQSELSDKVLTGTITGAQNATANTEESIRSMLENLSQWN